MGIINDKIGFWLVYVGLTGSILASIGLAYTLGHRGGLRDQQNIYYKDYVLTLEENEKLLQKIQAFNVKQTLAIEKEQESTAEKTAQIKVNIVKLEEESNPYNVVINEKWIGLLNQYWSK
jgi:hypothetical protein